MNYEEKYKNALRWIESIYPTLQSEQRMEAEGVFPELAESEDEKIPKLLHSLLCAEVTKGQFEKHGLTVDTALDWLEKQGELKEINYDEEVKKCKANPLYFFDKYVKVKIKEQKHVWSDADEERFVSCLQRLGTGNIEQPDTINTMWLKSIKNRVQSIAKFVGEEQYMKGFRDGFSDILQNPKKYGLTPPF